MLSKERIRYALIRRKFRLLRKLRMNNFLINRILTRADSTQITRLPVPIASLSLEKADYFKLIATKPLHGYKKFSYFHSKPLEYLSTISLMDLRGNEHILDAAGGADAEYLKALKLYTGLPVNLYCQDALVSTTSHENGITYIGGSIENVHLPDESLNCISCHHSFEHFQKDLDILFLKEAVRLLRPNGKLIIVPLFLTNIAAEIWNERPPARFDAKAKQIYDFTASFGGWGPYEGFARTYSPDSFKNKILSILPSFCSAKIVEITVNRLPVPDIRKNHHQPKINEGMRALVVKKAPR